MKMLMIIVDDQFNEQVEATLEQFDVKGFTEIPMAYGEGSTGKRLGSRLHPGASTIVFSIVPDEKVHDLKQALVGACGSEEECKSGNIHIAVLGVEDFI